MSRPPATTTLPSEVTVLKTKAAAKRGTGSEATETTWPKPEFGPGTVIANVTNGTKASGFIIPAGSMFPLGCAIPAKTTLEYGAYFPPGTMFPDGCLVPIHARMVSVQPLPTTKPPPAQSEAVCVIM
ncbi:hypothetical protein Q5752_005941 [Cryptotrichosporon argae]